MEETVEYEVEQDQVEEVAEEVEAAEETTEEPETEEANEQAEPQEEMDEWEADGKKYTIPKAIKANLMMQADYTRKTQELAEQRKAIQEEKERHVQANQEYLRDVSKVLAVDDQIEQYKKLDWNALTNEDPVQAQQLFIQFQTLKDQREALARQVDQREAERNKAKMQSVVEKREQGIAELQRDIPNWGPDVDRAITSFAINELGLSQEMVSSIIDPKVVKTLYRHMTVEAENKRLKAELAKLNKPQPAKKVGGGTSPNMTKKLSDPNLSDDEWLALRRSQLKRK